MKLQSKLLISFGLVLITAFSLGEIVGYQQTHDSILSDLRQDAREIQGILMATRRVYHHQFINSELPLNENTLSFLPAYVMHRISDEFQNWSNSGLTFNNVSDRPRNPDNQADAIELEALAYFRANPIEKERLIPFENAQGESFYHFSSPIWIEEYCLECHGEKSKAPETIRQQYDTSFNYKLGELRGVMSIKLPASSIEKAIADVRTTEAWAHLIAFIIAFTFGAWFLRKLIIRRLLALQLAADNLAEGDYAARVPVEGQDELTDVALSFNVMAREQQMAEMALRKSEEQYRGLFNGARDALMLLTPPSWQFTTVNPATVTLFGAKDEAEFISLDPWTLSPERQPDGQPSSDKAKEMIDTALRKGSHFFEWRHKRLNGEEFPATVLLSHMELDGQTTLLATVRDISAQKQAEDSLDTVFEALPDLFFRMTTDGTILDYRAQKSSNLYVEPENFLGKRMQDVLPPQVGKQLEQKIEQALETRQLLTFEYDLTMPQGTRHYESRLVSISDNNQLIAIVRDITQRKQTEESALEQEQHIRDLLDATAEAIIGVDPDGICSFANPASLQILGYHDADELIGHNLHETIHHKRPDGTLYPREECPMYRTLTSGDGFHVDTELLWRADGSSFQAEYWSHPIYRDGQVVGSVVTFLDITKRKHAEEGLRRTQKMDAIGQITGGIAHDFNNILAVILGNLELFERQMTMDDKGLKRVADMKKAGQRAANLTRQLLNFSRSQPEQTTATDINKVIMEMENLLSRSLTPEVEVEHHFADDLWLTEIDPGDFEDALLNLSINARDAMAGHGQLTIETSNVTLDELYCRQNPGISPGEYVELSVSDSGEGIPRKQQEHIFEPFFTTKERGKGTGLGLAMVFSFVKRSRGNIKCYSEVGVGTTFRLYLPRAEGEESLHGEESVQPEALPRGTETILVVDDEPALVELARESLEAQGYRVLTANDGKHALEQLAEEPTIALLFSDVVMPGGINGYELAEQATTNYPELKVLLTSGYTEKAASRNGHTHFNANLLSKPYSQTDLAKRIRSVMDASYN